MATTLQGQWNAAYGATTVFAQLDQNPTFFSQRVAMAMTAAAIAISTESNTTPDHANRVAFAKLVLQTPSVFMMAFVQALASQGLDNSSTDAQINTTVSAVWNGFSG